ncbi:hypothetical protein K7887_18435 [Sutcliffiella horikoshii]|uniref:hypothetical protein n=1 Tax=Sutcliffiella horikoshii TaxID=79883 RepID=UPI001CBC9E2D|nr:hypothetical protein [Sutcliffiella horikoshii]UAL46821.1 hypothetical protein K7887_18435 [Sutcliffiella horikoshii]
MDLAFKSQIVHLKSKVVSLGLNVEEDWQQINSPEKWMKDIKYILQMLDEMEPK